MRPEPRLSKSRYITGLQCSRRLWLGWHDPEPYTEPELGSVLAVGIEVGVAARRLLSGGILVAEGPREHAEAVERTRVLIADPAIPVIFEAAFAFDRVLIRADILERLPGGGWRLAEVKSTPRVKPEHLHDLAIQAYVIAGSGVVVDECQLIHIDRDYVRGANGIDWRAYFERADVTSDVRALLPAVPDRIAGMHAVLNAPGAPDVRPDRHCFTPFPCEFWGRCTVGKPTDWILRLPHLKAKDFAELDALGIDAMRDIPPDFPLSRLQRRIVDAARSGREWIAPDIDAAIAALGPPAACLDFETFAPAIPLYPGTRPYQRLPVLWSLHYDDGRGTVSHAEFLAAGDIDPRREFAEALLGECDRIAGPIVVYSGFEAAVLRDLATSFPDLSPRFVAIVNRLRDLLPIIRGFVSHPAFLGSYSLKSVAPALVPGFTYDDLDDVADGNDASAAFFRLAADRSLSSDDRARLRRGLLSYCRRDTLALLRLHQQLIERIKHRAVSVSEPSTIGESKCRYVKILERFNRKERNLVIRHILGHTANPLRLDVKFRYKVSTALNLESQIPESISWWTDYHISWLAGALVLFAMGPEVASKASPTGSGILENRQLSNHRWLVEGGGEDIDLVLAYDHELILIEAKGDAFLAISNLKVRSSG
jgi:predicted RecB family nuclease